MKKLLIAGIVMISIGCIFLVLGGINYLMFLDTIQKLKTNPSYSGPLIDPFDTKRDVIHGLILLSIGIGIVIVSKRYVK